MKKLTIREASEAIGRAPATIRRYIKSGRLAAEQEQGKFGVEYKIDRQDLQALGLGRGEMMRPSQIAAPPRAPLPVVKEPIGTQMVPRELYSELAMKHERLLVQYGMLRAGGQKLLEYRADVEMKNSLLSERENEIREIRERSQKEIRFLQDHLRKAEIEIEDRNIELTQLREKLRRSEMNLAGAAAFRSFEEEVRSSGGMETTPTVAASEPEKTNPDARKIDLLQDWLRACETERERGPA